MRMPIKIQKIIQPSLPISISCVLLFFITACSHVAGNVIPDNGPTMESIYDDVGDHRTSADSMILNRKGDAHLSSSTADQKMFHEEHQLSISAEPPAFSLLENPELKLYILPHLAGSEMLPIPGYWTAFSAYPRNYYTLPLTVNPRNR